MLLGKAVRFLDLDRRSHTLYQSCMFHLLAGEDLHPSQLPILWAIAQTGAISQGQVARVLGVSRAAVWKAVGFFWMKARSSSEMALYIMAGSSGFDVFTGSLPRARRFRNRDLFVGKELFTSVLRPIN